MSTTAKTKGLALFLLLAGLATHAHAVTVVGGGTVSSSTSSLTSGDTNYINNTTSAQLATFNVTSGTSRGSLTVGIASATNLSLYTFNPAEDGPTFENRESANPTTFKFKNNYKPTSELYSFGANTGITSSGSFCVYLPTSTTPAYFTDLFDHFCLYGDGQGYFKSGLSSNIFSWSSSSVNAHVPLQSTNLTVTSNTLVANTTFYPMTANGSQMVMYSSGTSPIVSMRVQGAKGSNFTNGGFFMDITSSTGHSGIKILHTGTDNVSDDTTMLRLESTSSNYGGYYIRVKNQSTTSNPELRIDSPNPDIELIESDQVGTNGTGKFEISVQDDNMLFGGRNTADSSFDGIFYITRNDSGDDGSITMMDSNAVRFAGSSGSYRGFKGSATYTGSGLWTLPTSLTNSGQVFYQQTDSPGYNLGFTSGGSDGDILKKNGLNPTWLTVLPYANGGTGVSSATNNTLLIGNGNGWTHKTIPNCGSDTVKLLYDQTTGLFGCGTDQNTGSSNGVSVYPATGTIQTNQGINASTFSLAGIAFSTAIPSTNSTWLYNGSSWTTVTSYTTYYQEVEWSTFQYDGSTNTAFYTAGSSDVYFGAMQFSNSSSSETNKAYVRTTMNLYVDTLTLAGFELIERSTGTDTSTRRFVVSMMISGDVGAYDTFTPTNAVNFDFAADATGGSGKIHISSTTLSGWNSSFVGNQYLTIEVARDGNASQDASTVDDYIVGMKLWYWKTRP